MIIGAVKVSDELLYITKLPSQQYYYLSNYEGQAFKFSYYSDLYDAYEHFIMEKRNLPINNLMIIKDKTNEK